MGSSDSPAMVNHLQDPAQPRSFLPFRADRFHFRSIRSYLTLSSPPASPASEPQQDSQVDYEDLTYALTPLPPTALPGGYSPKATSLNLAATAFGASILSLPFTLGHEATGGPFFGLISLLLIGGLALASAEVFVAAARRHSQTSYSGVVERAFGRTVGKIALTLVNVCIFVAAVSYIVGIAENLPSLIPVLQSWERWALILLALALTTPATMARDVGVFSFLSGVVCSIVGILAFALFLRSVIMVGGNEDDVKGDIGYASVVFGLNIGTWIAKAWPYQTFVYAFHYVIPNILSQLEAPSPARVTVTFRSTILNLVCPYLIFSLAGWFLCHGGLNWPLDPNFLIGASKGDWVVAATTWVITLTLLFTYQLFLIPLRKKVEGRFHCVDSPHVSDGVPIARVVASLSWQLIVFLISILLKDLGAANAVAGGCIGLVMFTFPGALMIEEVVTRRSKEHGVRRADSRYGSHGIARSPEEGEDDEDEDDVQEEHRGLLHDARVAARAQLPFNLRAKAYWNDVKAHLARYSRWDYLWMTAGFLMSAIGIVVAIFGVAAAF